MSLEQRIHRARPVLTKLIAEQLESLGPGATMGAGRLTRAVLTAAGFRLPASTRVLPLLMPLLDELRQQGRLHILQRGHLVRRGVEARGGPLRIAPAPGGGKETRPHRAKPRRFDYALDFTQIDFRKTPELYRVGKGEQGVLLVEPYKSEILPLWRFRNEAVAKTSAAAIFRRFRAYLAEQDVVGADMARKFLQMGFTRARRYANYPGGRKYDERSGAPKERKNVDFEKARAAAVFYRYYVRARDTAQYRKLVGAHKEKFG